MRYRPIGDSGLEASVIGLGTWVSGGGEVWGQEVDDDESVRAIEAAIDSGINLIDTAPAYGLGRAEKVVGRAIKGKRDSVIVATKCGLRWDDISGTFMSHLYGKDVYRNTRPSSIAHEVEMSLQRLDIGTIDLYQVHWPTVDHMTMPIADTMAMLMKLKEQGKIRAIGVSNYSACEIEQSVKRGDVHSDQGRYSFLSQRQEEAAIEECSSRHLAFIAYQPLEQGLLTGKVTMETVYPEGDVRNSASWNPWFVPERREKVIEVLNGWDDLMHKYDCSLAQLVLAWTVEQRGVTHALVGARTVKQAEANARGGEIILGDHDIERMSKDAQGLLRIL
ncbi:aldo/keto reductase [Poriferisphaera sp. WC338]|uniref:aldo/keto reductase n=1 Tax=Poriferisphaera sp. WC338 TaxID=3425129 RepID=UPI003D81AF29